MKPYVGAEVEVAGGVALDGPIAEHLCRWHRASDTVDYTPCSCGSLPPVDLADWIHENREALRDPKPWGEH